MKKLLFLFTASALMLAGCKGDGYDYDPKGDSQGDFSLNLTPYGTYSTGNTTDTYTKTDETPQANTDEFIIRIKNESDVIVKQWERYADMPSVVTLDKGNYTLEAYSPDQADAAFDQPMFYGSQQMTIQAGSLNSLDVLCSISNMKVTLNYSDRFFQELEDDFEVIISNGKGVLVFDKDVTAAGYFTVGALSFNVKATRKIDGAEISQSGVISEEKVAARKHFIINVDAVATGDASPGISIDTSTDDEEIIITIPGEEEGGGDPDPGPDPNPDTSPEISGLGLDAPYTINDADAAAGSVLDINIKASEQIAELWISFESDFLTEEFLEDVLGFSNAKFDLANMEPGSQVEEAMTEMHLFDPADPIVGKTLFDVTLGSFLPLLPSGLEEGQTEMTHKFHVKVVDKKGQATTATLTVHRVKE